jgi:molybdopterin biosynthesis enzyme
LLTAGDDGRLLATPAEGQASHQLRALAEANGLALLPDGTGVDAGEDVAVVILDASRVVPPGAFGLGPGYALAPTW